MDAVRVHIMYATTASSPHSASGTQHYTRIPMYIIMCFFTSVFKQPAMSTAQGWVTLNHYQNSLRIPILTPSCTCHDPTSLDCWTNSHELYTPLFRTDLQNQVNWVRHSTKKLTWSGPMMN